MKLLTLLCWKSLPMCYLIFKIDLNQAVGDIIKFRSV